MSGFQEMDQVVEDTQWANGQLRFIVNVRHYSPPPGFSESRGTMTSQEWSLITIPFPSQPGSAPQTRRFLRMAGNYEHLFSSIEGSDLLIHQLLPLDEPGRKFLLFDPTTGKDVSKPLPTNAETCLFNRSRTACLTMEGKRAVILSTLSTKAGEPKVLAQPEWAGVMQRLKYGEYGAVLTENCERLVLFPHITSPSYVVATNFNCEVWSTNGNVEKQSLPIERKMGKFVDAEVIDGKVMLMWRALLSNGAEDAVELLNSQGETLHSGRISAFTSDPLWNYNRSEVLFPYNEAEGWERELPRRFYLWNYSSNTVQQISVSR